MTVAAFRARDGPALGDPPAKEAKKRFHRHDFALRMACFIEIETIMANAGNFKALNRNTAFWLASQWQNHAPLQLVRTHEPEGLNTFARQLPLTAAVPAKLLLSDIHAVIRRYEYV